MFQCEISEGGGGCGVALFFKKNFISSCAVLNMNGLCAFFLGGGGVRLKYKTTLLLLQLCIFSINSPLNALHVYTENNIIKVTQIFVV